MAVKGLDGPALRRALRAALVGPAVFALTLTLFGPEAATFGVFGSFGLLLFAEFSGPWRRRLAAYLVLAGAGAGLVTLGTLCSSRVEIAVIGTVLVGFGVVFAGAVNGYFAAATTSALLAFVLPVTIPAATAPVGDRLLGWFVACAVCIPAVMLLWPHRGRNELRSAAVEACSALADVLAAAGSPGLTTATEQSRTAMDTLASRVVATPYRTTGPTVADLALVSLIDEVRWLPPFVYALAADPPVERDPVEQEAMAAASAALRSAGAVLAGRREQPDRARLDAARDALMPGPDAPADMLRRVDVIASLDTAFRLHAVTSLVGSISRLAAVAAGTVRPGWERAGAGPVEAAAASLRGTAETLRATGGIAADLASPRAVWFRNSLRAAVGLGLAVLVTQLADLQHAFWAVLGTLSVLRSSALGTGKTALRAVAGTVLGLVVGIVVMVAIGTSEPLLWVVLPVVVFLAGYGPAVSFVAAQAAFTTTVVVLFNLIQPAGWQVGLVRVEDVAVGCVVAIGVGLLFWPRGAARVLANSLAAAYAAGAELVRTSGRRLLDGSSPDDAGEADRAARTADRRVDDAFRQYVAERGSSPLDIGTLARAVTGAIRLRLTAESLDRLRPGPAGVGAGPEAGARLFEADLAAVHRWYAAAAEALAGRIGVPDPAEPVVDRTEMLRASLSGGDGTGLQLAWAGEYVEELRELEGRIAGPIAAVVKESSAPWWR